MFCGVFAELRNTSKNGLANYATVEIEPIIDGLLWFTNFSSLGYCK